MTARSGAAPAGRGRRLRPRMVLALILAVLAVVFVLQNREAVQINLFTMNLSSPLWLLLVVMFALGALVGFLASRRR